MHIRDHATATLQIKAASRKINARGFTLVELTIAIAILALVAVLGWRGLDGIVRARVTLTSEMEATRALQLTFAQLQSDAAQLAPASLLLARPTVLALQNRLLMVRMVFAEQQPARVQIVDYRLINGELQREESTPTRDLNALDAMWQSALNDAGNGATQAVQLQSHIASLQMQVWDSDALVWRPADATATGSQSNSAGGNRWTGLEVALQLQGHSGNMVKTFLLGGV
ncbi:PulJ/GspJ family protein [Glaciimonas immobilis]|uniref:General secretion pathway protein J n=1 Tax=Glaciimonas immobilis TaxID=728004 RepID=A0A840RX67_9BURK|nr:prepilin-type N-terminal cleavage/methylation domain-containing protein [Glaciimonas immobilis]KAF3996615.1 prepilin-type N-terminal cleavage/methylation domain-containing protein [Glaciimonas immobilis]MBB5201009.1 general secretion pathway protein J [Glaciimonas immobilis]